MYGSTWSTSTNTSNRPPLDTSTYGRAPLYFVYESNRTDPLPPNLWPSMWVTNVPLLPPMNTAVLARLMLGYVRVATVWVGDERMEGVYGVRPLTMRRSPRGRRRRFARREKKDIRCTV